MARHRNDYGASGPRFAPIGGARGKPTRFFCEEHRVEFDLATEGRKHAVCEITSNLPSSRRLVSLSTTAKRAEVKFIRHSCGIAQFDELLGGGMVRGSAILITAPPGLGKSTLVLQILLNAARAGGQALYISGEESEAQVLNRVRVVGDVHPNLSLLSTGSWEAALAHIVRIRPHVIAVDSLQRFATIFGGAKGAAGTDAQVRAMALAIVHLCKHMTNGWAPIVLVIGHVNADHKAGGPEAARHDLDVHVVLSSGPNGEVLASCPEKNRFGAKGVVAGFRFENARLAEIPDVSTALLAGAMGEPGAVAFPAAHHARIIVAPVEAAVSGVREAAAGKAWRALGGLTEEGLRDVLDLLRQHGDFSCDARDVRLQTPLIAGAPLDDRAFEAALCCAAVSSAEGRTPARGLAVFGSFSLTGKLRPPDRLWDRLAACARLGIRVVIGPPTDGPPETPRGVTYVGVRDLRTMLEEFRRRCPVEIAVPRPVLPTDPNRRVESPERAGDAAPAASPAGIDTRPHGGVE